MLQSEVRCNSIHIHLLCFKTSIILLHLNHYTQVASRNLSNMKLFKATVFFLLSFSGVASARKCNDGSCSDTLDCPVVACLVPPCPEYVCKGGCCSLEEPKGPTGVDCSTVKCADPSTLPCSKPKKGDCCYFCPGGNKRNLRA